MNKKTILLTEDDTSFRQSLKMTLEINDYNVIEASNGIEALKELKKTPIDLLITDMLMPEMEGVELAVKVKETKPDLKIIGMTGGGATVDAENAKKVGELFVDAFLKKPFSSEEIMHEIDAVLNQ